MKTQFACLLTAVGIMSLFTSCSSDDDPVVPGSSLGAKTYTTAEGLSLSVNGNAIPGKAVTFTPVSAGNATVTLAGEPFDIGAIIGGVLADNPGSGLTIPTAGVLPGSTSVTIPVVLNGEGNNCTFQGTSETEYCTFAYAGHVTDGEMDMKLTDVKLKNQSLAGSKWTVPVYEYNDDTWEWEGVQDIRVVWESSRGLDLFGSGNPEYEVPINGIIGMVFMMGLVDDPMGEEGQKTTLYDLMHTVLKEVTFGEDGTVSANYLDLNTKNYVSSKPGIAQYVVTGDNTLKLYLNPQAIVEATVNASKSSRTIDINTVVEGLMTNLIPLVSNGIPVHMGQAVDNMTGAVVEDPSVTSFYMGTETVLPILKIASPILSDKDVIDAIVKAVENDPDMGSMAGMLSGILKSLPAVIDGTTKIEVGINLKK